jgi:hypothetical protein
VSTWPYTGGYKRARAALLASGPLCVHCGLTVATEADHEPPVALHVHVEGSACCVLVPSCSPCARKQAGVVSGVVLAARRSPVVEAEPVGFDVGSVVWDAAGWLDDLRDVPNDAVWPRLMTVPHPFAVGSLGDEFCRSSTARTGKVLRWWQRLVAVRLLEVDAAGRLIWDSLVLTLSRQLGKSWLLREICLWRMEQGDRFGEPQLVLHTGRDLAVCKEVQRPARVWAKGMPDVFKVREVNGQEEIELLRDGSRWMLRAKDAVYGYGASLAGVDEAWKVPALSIEEGLYPTMIEREQPQLILLSTAHRRATSLMVNRRTAAIADLADPDRDLIVEWSCPRSMSLDDAEGWKLASPHWTDRRRRVIAGRLKAAREGVSDDVDEPDPLEAFRAQWLNQWPVVSLDPVDLKGELLVDADAWGATYGTVVDRDRIWIGLEDYGGTGAAVAAAIRLDDGRIGVDGWLCPSWDAAVADVRRVTVAHSRYRLLVGASLEANVPTDLRSLKAGSRETRSGLPLLRQLVNTRMVVHEVGDDLDAQVAGARVTRATDGSLLLLAGQRTDLLRAACWAVQSAHHPTRQPAIH